MIQREYLVFSENKENPKDCIPSLLSQLKGADLIVRLARKVTHGNVWRMVILGINKKKLIKYFNNIKLLSLHKKMKLFQISTHRLGKRQ